MLRGTGDLAEVLSAQAYLPWDTEEFAAVVRWMRAYMARERQPWRFGDFFGEPG